MTSDMTPGRLRRHGRPEHPGDAGPDPLPPYQVTGVQMIYLTGQLANVPGLPSGLVQAASHTCRIALYRADAGWGIAPLAVTYARIALDGLNGPDRSEAMFHIGGSASGRGGQILRRDYNHHYRQGETHLSESAGQITAQGSFGLGGLITLDARFDGPATDPVSGAHRELAVSGGGSLVEWSVGYHAHCRPLSVSRCDIALPEDHPSSFLSRFHLEEAWWLFDKSFTLTAPQPFHMATVDPVKCAVLTLIAQLFDRFALIEPTGKVVHASAGLQGLLGSGAAVQAALGHTWDYPLTLPFVLPTATGPALVRLLPLSPALWPSGARLATVTLPGERATPAPEAHLRLLGLTPAEARAALAAASGLTAAQIALDLGLTSNTVRSTLKLVYAKLGIGRRSDLGAMVARL